MVSLEGVSLIGVVAATIASMVVGMVWYGPIFGKLWMSTFNKNEQASDAMKKSGKAMVGALISTFVMALIFAVTLRVTDVTTWTGGAEYAFWMWLGFVAPAQTTGALFQQVPMKRLLIDTFHYLAVLLVMATVLTLM